VEEPRSTARVESCQGCGNGRQLILGGETNLKHDVVPAVLIIINVNFVQDLWVEGKPCGAICRLQKGLTAMIIVTLGTAVSWPATS